MHELEAAFVDHGGADHGCLRRLHCLFSGGAFVTLRSQIEAAYAGVIQADVGVLIADDQRVLLVYGVIEPRAEVGARLRRDDGLNHAQRLERAA